MLRLAALLIWLLPVPGFAVPWVLDPGTQVAVDVAWTGGRVEVRFPRLGGTIDFDERRPQDAAARISVAARDATTGIAIADALMKSDAYLATERFPEIVFELDRLEQTSRSTADIFGRMTLRGVTRPVVFRATVFRYGPAADDPARFEAGFELEGAVDRREFGMTSGFPDIAAELPVRIRLLMTSR
jgi:polyisoprenoid-binding protein YceI